MMSLFYLADHMREVEVPIWHDCKSTIDRAGKEICAGFKEGGKDTCQVSLSANSYLYIIIIIMSKKRYEI